MKQITFLVIVIGTFFSCRPPEKNVPTYYLPTPLDAFSFGYFKPGTYWIYQDSTSHLIDSVYVISADQSTISINGASSSAQSDGYGGTFRRFGYQAHSSFEGVEYVNSVDRDHTPLDQVTTTIIRTRIPPHQFQQECIYLNIPYTLNTVVQAPTYNFNDSNVVVRDNAIFTFNSVSLTNVLEIHQAHNPLCHNLRTKTFIKKGYGILRKEVPDSNRVWNLIRCNIVQ
jgi:hypothetical protein